MNKQDSKKEIHTNSMTEAIVKKIKKSFKISQSNLYIPYRKRSYLIIQTLMCILCLFLYFNLVNNYEVNLIDKYYLLLWDNNKRQNYIPIERIINDFNSPYHGIVQTFFHYFQIYYDDYFLFVCVFAFCNITQILYILLASCQLYPAKYISKDDINQFLKSTKIAQCSYEMFSRIAKIKVSNNNNNNNNKKSLSPTSPKPSPDSSNIINNLNNNNVNNNNNNNTKDSNISSATTTNTSTFCSPVEQYSLKSLIDFILSCESYRKLVNDIKKTLINVVITPPIYSTIVKRLNFYNNCIDDKNITIPKESCTSKTLRVLFSNRPEPYHYDFRLQSITPNGMNTVVKKIIMNYKASGTLSPALEVNKRKLKVKHTKEKEKEKEDKDKNKTNNNSSNSNNNMLMLSDRMHHHTKLSPQNLRKADSENNVKSLAKEISPLQSSYPRIFVNRISPVESIEESEK